VIPLVLAYKFHGYDTLAAPAARRLADLARRTALDADLDAVVPIPSTRRRNRERGYDPSLLLARSLAGALGKPLACLVARTRDTPPQSQLPARRREANVRGAFRASRRAQGLAILLVDDVVTTGATAFAAARALRDAGASRVDLLALARTPEPHDFRRWEVS
jgi:ComF family protein